MPADDASEALRALPEGVAQPAGTLDTIARDAQVRLWWEGTPVDLFFDAVPVHAATARNRRDVPFEGEWIPVLGPTELAAFKATFDRTRDWADIRSDDLGRNARHRRRPRDTPDDAAR